MNYSMIFYIIGWILDVEAALLVPSLAVSLIYHESCALAFFITIVLCLIPGVILVRKQPKNKVFYAREGSVTVALSWIVMSIMGSIPFLLSGSITNPVDALFETVSGFTTTGASILPAVEPLQHGILFWRSFTHWIGGMGVLVFLLCLLPLTGSGYHMNLMKAESPGPSVTKLVPKVQSTAKILYGLYLFLTVLEFILLLVGRMPVFDSLCTVFGTAGTGGFGIKNDSFGSYSTYLQGVVTVFMILFGINFNVYFLFYMKKPKEALRCEEARWYLGIIATSILVITFFVRDFFDSLFLAFHHVAFQVASIMAAYILIFAISVLLIGIDNFDLVTNFTAVAATLNNIGPGLELVGPAQNFGLFSNFSKLVLTFDMLAGRLELFPLLLLFYRGTWKRF